MLKEKRVYFKIKVNPNNYSKSLPKIFAYKSPKLAEHLRPITSGTNQLSKSSIYFLKIEAL